MDVEVFSFHFFFDFLLVFQFFPVSDTWEPVQNLMIRWPQGRCACVRVKERERERSCVCVCVRVCSWMWHTKAFFQVLKLRAAICSLSPKFSTCVLSSNGGMGMGGLACDERKREKLKSQVWSLRPYRVLQSLSLCICPITANVKNPLKK